MKTKENQTKLVSNASNCLVGFVLFSFYLFLNVDDKIRPNGPFEKGGPLDDN